MKVGKYTIRWRYHRYDPAPKLSKEVYDDRNYTVCLIESLSVKASQLAVCHPNDNFCKDTGRKISLAKAMEALALTKEEKREIWEAYRMMSPKKRW